VARGSGTPASDRRRRPMPIALRSPCHTMRPDRGGLSGAYGRPMASR